MLYKKEYVTPEERQALIDQNKDKTLIEEQNILEGNFLIFSDIPPVENQLKDIKNNIDMILLKQEGII